MVSLSLVAVLLAALCLVLGLAAGAFWNRLIERMPFDKSLRGAGVCAACGAKIPLWVEVPVLGFLLARGKNPCCQAPRGKAWLLVPLVSALLALAAFCVWLLFAEFDQVEGLLKLSEISKLLVLEWLFLTLVPVFVIDFRHHLLPDSVSVGGIVFGFAVSFFPEGLSPLWSLASALVTGGGLFVFAKLVEKALRKDAMGFGDVKLLAGYGAIMGAPLAVETLVLASLLGVCVMLPLRHFKKGALALEGGASAGEFPFGPFLAFAAPIVFVFGGAFLEFYLGFFEV